jgi:hypothetical protein
MSQGAYSQDILATAKRLDSDVKTGQSVASGASYTYDVEVSNSDWLEISATLTGAAIGDLAVTVQPYFGDNVTLESVVLTPVAAPANVFSGGVVSYYARYDVIGIGKVRIFAKNNNAGSQTLGLSWRTQGF